MLLVSDAELGYVYDTDFLQPGLGMLVYDAELGYVYDTRFQGPETELPDVPVITDISAFRLGELLTITFDREIQTDPVSITANGIELTNLQLFSETQIQAQIDLLGGYGPVNGQIAIVVTDNVGPSAPASVTVLPPTDWRCAVLNAGITTAPGTAAGDEIIHPAAVEYGGQMVEVSVDADGYFTYGLDRANIGIPYFVRDASDSYRGGELGEAFSPSMYTSGNQFGSMSREMTRGMVRSMTR